MKPVLFPAMATTFSNLGLGVLADTSSCIVTEERNGVYELQMQYPASGPMFRKIKNRCIIYAEVNQKKERQPFRIYRITKPLRGIVTIYAQHLSYDLSGIVLSPFSANTIQAAMAGISANSSTENPFVFTSDKQTTSIFSVKQPSTVRSVMGGQAGSLLDVYGGEYAYDHYTVKLLNRRGQDNGVTIRYGKNLTDLTQEENIQSVYTGVYPFWTSDDEYIELPEKIVSAAGTYDFVRIRPLDASSHFDEAPTVEQLRNYAVSFAEANQIGIPSVSIAVKFVALEQTEEYKHLIDLQQVSLCDTVTVIFEKLGVNASAKCIKTVYDVLLGRYKEIALGDAKTNITDTIAGQNQDIKKLSSPSYIQAVAGSASQIITGNKGGYVVLHSSTGEPWPDEILVMDTPSPQTAKNVWRWNKSGLGYSSTGYNGEYKLAMTIDGRFVADFISAGTLNAENLKVINFWADNLRSVGVSATGRTDELFISESTLAMSSNGVRRLSVQLAEDGSPGIYLINASDQQVARLTSGGLVASSIAPSSNANFAWEYNSTLGKTILVQK